MPRENVVSTSAIAPARKADPVIFSIAAPFRISVVRKADIRTDIKKVSIDKFFIIATLA